MRNNCAMFPGTFDPPTLGHVDIIKRSASLYDELYVVIADNINKKTLFTAEERKSMLENIFKDYDNVKIMIWQGLVVDFARKHDIGVMIRGVRALVDFGYEFELAETNKQLCPEIEILFMPSNPQYFLIRSSSIKEMASFGADISKLVPLEVCQAVINKLKC